MPGRPSGRLGDASFFCYGLILPRQFCASDLRYESDTVTQMWLVVFGNQPLAEQSIAPVASEWKYYYGRRRACISCRKSKCRRSRIGGCNRNPRIFRELRLPLYLFPNLQRREFFSTFSANSESGSALYAVAAKRTSSQARAAFAFGGSTLEASGNVPVMDAIQPQKSDEIEAFFGVRGMAPTESKPPSK